MRLEKYTFEVREFGQAANGVAPTNGVIGARTNSARANEPHKEPLKIADF
jgi:hypothetical protein